ncbi:glycoside hydrolase [Ruegeria pomeroyi]|jgi:hypothetical protein|uniref:BNR/Asp-box repeat domain protein n=2 Tax=Ruegeria pomeroyi TaxID=89184 RepID=Q5LRB9_RUEPO|nr:sialidase family protein [Ruegeria pomeroyi]AAV95476.1 BNR/Asp-box repeat domain protein [Ruegeria pomeroyi DSS-3]NVK97080.1 exo-alpha-sialidase [Ruegeria pomeroyi]NVL03575.1 exo-alpha-sialidase [Ruegeria pomeroyi]QWV09042.1 glycoside hydrolase [Ruegeria pomeroyi]
MSVLHADTEPRFHPLQGSIVKSYDPVTIDVHPGPLLYDPSEERLWRVFSEARSHQPSFGMSVTAEFSDDSGCSWQGRRTIFPGDQNLKILATSGIYLNGRLMVIVNTENASNQRSLKLIYSDDHGASWLQQTPDISTNSSHFLFGITHRYDANAGGHDDNGAVFYTYHGGSAFAFTTADKGATWSTHTVFDMATTQFINDQGQVATDFVASELTIARVPQSDDYVLYIRGSGYPNYLAATSTDMTSVGTTALTMPRDSGILNEGYAPNKSVGSPPHLVSFGDEITLYTFGRENWVKYDIPREQAMLSYTQNAQDLFANKGIFANKVPRVAARLPTRAVGMMFHVDTTDSIVAHLRAGESIYEINNDVYSPCVGQLYFLSRTQIPSNVLTTRENLLDNPTFDLWARGDSFTDVTANGTPVAERWQLWCSGDTLTATREDVDHLLSNNQSFKPKYAMRVKSTGQTGNDYSGIRQVFYGKNNLRRFSERELTLTIYGIGELPSNLRFSIHFYNRDNPTIITHAAATLPVPVTAAGQFTSTSATLYTPSEDAVALGDNPGIAIVVDQLGTDLWDFAFAGLKLEAGFGSSVLSYPNLEIESSKALYYFERFGFDSGIGLGTQRADNDGFRANVKYHPKTIVPSIVTELPKDGFGNPIWTNKFEIRHLTGTTACTGIKAATTIAQKDQAWIDFWTKEAEFDYYAGECWSIASDAGFFIDVEA